MEILDSTYLNDLVTRAQGGSSNAFAELYAATFRTQYARACEDLGDPDQAKEALKEAYTRALKGIGRLQSPDLFIAWLNQIMFRVCFEIAHRQSGEDAGDGQSPRPGGILEYSGVEEIEVDRKKYTVRQVLDLPLIESQVILMKYLRRMGTDEIANLMNLNGREVRHFLRFGKRHLQKMLF